MESPVHLVEVDTHPNTTNGPVNEPAVDYDQDIAEASNREELLKVAIKNNDVIEMLRILKAMDPIAVDLLSKMNEDVVDRKFGMFYCNEVHQQLRVSKPLFLCIVYQSPDCLRTLLDMRFNIHILDRRGNNVVHLLAYIGRANPSEVIIDMYDMIIGSMPAKERIEKRRLLFHRSFDGLNPLELAAKLQVSSLFKSILYTDGVYKDVLREDGIVTRNSYKFPTSPSGHSFLWQMVWTEDDPELNNRGNYIANLPPVKYLIEKKFQKWLPLVFMWFLVRFLYIVFYIAFSTKAMELYDTYNCDSKNVLKNNAVSFPLWFATQGLPQMRAISDTIVAYSGLFCYASMLLDIVEIVYICKFWKITRQFFKATIWSNFRVNTNFYRIGCFLSALFICIHLHAAYLRLTWNSISDSVLLMSSILYIMIMILMFFNIFYFFQLVQIFSIGSFLIGMQRMLFSFIRFMSFQFFLFLCWSALFTYVRQFLCSPGSWTCVGDPTGFYGMFRIMLANFSLVPQTGECSGHGENMLYALHIGYIFFAVIFTLMNTLSMFVNVYQNFNSDASSLVTLHRLHMALVIERRVEIIRFFVQKIKPRWMKAKSEESIVVWELDN